MIKSNSRFIKVVSVFMGICILCSCGANKTSGNLTVDETQDKIENSKYSDFITKIDNYLTSFDFEGSVLLAKGDDIVLAKGYGLADRSNKIPNTMKTTFEIGSITKQFTAVSILQLQEQGKLSVDDTLDKYFPDFTIGKEITIKNLLRMESGLYDFLDDPTRFFPQDVGEQVQKMEDTEKEVDPDLVEKYLYQARFMTDPGKQFFYCNTNYYLLGKIVEKVSGISYDDYFQKKLFDVCGMSRTNTKFKATDAIGYDGEGKQLSITKNMAFGCGDINSNVIDVFKWDRSLIKNKLISEKSFTEMKSHSNVYGYGVFADSMSILHGGSTYVFNSYNEIHLLDDVTVIVLVNQPTEICSSTAVAGNLYKYFTNDL